MFIETGTAIDILGDIFNIVALQVILHDQFSVQKHAIPFRHAQVKVLIVDHEIIDVQDAFAIIGRIDDRIKFLAVFIKTDQPRVSGINDIVAVIVFSADIAKFDLFFLGKSLFKRQPQIDTG